MTNKQISNQRGMSLLEILVVITIFAILAIITTQAVLLTLAGSKKSQSLIKVRENLSYSISVVERQLRNADSITTCPNSDTSTISYNDQNGIQTSFSCHGIGTNDAYIASGSARLTGSAIKVTSCNFTCSTSAPPNPSFVTVDLEAVDAESIGIQNSKVTMSTQIFLRNY